MAKDKRAGPEKRRLRRTRTRKLVQGRQLRTKDGGTAFLAITLNLNSTGALLRTYQPFSVGDRTSLQLSLPDGDLEVRGTVRHNRCDAVGSWHVGVEFDEVDEPTHFRLTRLPAGVHFESRVLGTVLPPAPQVPVRDS